LGERKNLKERREVAVWTATQTALVPQAKIPKVRKWMDNALRGVVGQIGRQT
jgi:hypothetical protein